MNNAMSNEQSDKVSTENGGAIDKPAVMASASFSRNLTRFVIRKGVFGMRVYKYLEDGRWYIGYSDGHYFGGAKVLEALCHGGRMRTYSLTDKGRFNERTEQLRKCAHRFVNRHIAPGHY